ncbi:MAG: hypothetical protein IK084_06020 [Bacteroidaceae bacterium]|nr:hypothetical protein [Bacteroidaceae bacterium]
MINRDTTFDGTKLKYLLDIKATGFEMDRDDFDVLLRRGEKSLLLHKSDLVVKPVTVVENNVSIEKHEYYVCFDSHYFGPGTITVIVTMQVPDADFPDGFRTIVDKFGLINVLAV